MLHESRRPGIESATCELQVQRSTAKPPRSLNAARAIQQCVPKRFSKCHYNAFIVNNNKSKSPSSHASSGSLIHANLSFTPWYCHSIYKT